jgi:ketosteroid isomerase-like protein
MNKVLALIVLLNISSLPLAGQNTNSSTTTPARPRTTNQSTQPAKPAPTTSKSAAAPAPSPQTSPKSPAAVPGSDAVVAAFNRLREGIETTDVEKVMSVYWKHPSLILFNNNGTVTKGWEQVRLNRVSSYPEIKDVKLDVRDISVAMLGRDGAVVNCLWTQSQTYKGMPETASGRMTLVFKRFGANWKAIHLHTSSDNPNPAVIPPSEQTPKPSPSPSPTPE